MKSVTERKDGTAPSGGAAPVVRMTDNSQAIDIHIAVSLGGGARPPSQGADSKSPTLELALLTHAGMLYAISLFFGLWAQLYFPKLATLEAFSLYDEVGLSFQGQIYAFFLASVCLVIQLLSKAIRLI